MGKWRSLLLGVSWGIKRNEVWQIVFFVILFHYIYLIIIFIIYFCNIKSIKFAKLYEWATYIFVVLCCIVSNE